MRLWLSHLILATGLLSSGCQGTSLNFKGLNLSKAGKSRSKTNSTDANAPSSEDDSTVGEESSRMSFEEVQNTSTRNYFLQAIENSSNDPLTVSGYIFSNLRDFLAENTDVVDDASARYETLGSYLDTIGIFSVEDIQLDRVYRGLWLLEKIVGKNNKGSANFFLAGPYDQDMLIAASSPQSGIASQAALHNLGTRQLLDDDDDWGHFVDPEDEPYDPASNPGHLPGAPSAW